MTATLDPASAEAIGAIRGQPDEPRPAASLTSTMVRRRGASASPLPASPPPSPLAEPALAPVLTIAEDEPIRPVADGGDGRERPRAWADATLFAAAYVLALAAFLLAFVLF